MRCKDFIFARKDFKESKPVRQDRGYVSSEIVTNIPLQKNNSDSMHMLEKIFQKYYNPS